MICPDWRSLAARRDTEPGAWRRGLDHFDGCSRCRDRALAAEPTLLFRRLPAPATGREEVTAMKQAVAAMRRAAAVQHAPVQHAQLPRAARTSWLRSAALAAVLLIAALLQGAFHTEHRSEAAPPAVADPVAVAIAPADPAATLELEQMPLVEYIDPTSGPVIQVVDDEISLVVVLPASFDV